MARHGLLLLLALLLYVLPSFCTQQGAQQDLQRFLDWLREGGAQHSRLQVTDFRHSRPIYRVGRCKKDTSACYRGVVATGDAAADDVVLSIPFTLGAIEVDGQPQLPEPYKGSSAEARIATWLLRERALGDGSNFSSYMSMLPQRITMPLFFTDQELSNLQFEAAIAGAKETVSMVDREHKKCWRSWFSRWPVADFKWAMSMGLSRLYEAQAESRPGRRASLVMLVPFADMLNHHADPHVKWRVDWPQKRFEMVAVRSIRKGEEVFSTYGRKPYEDWLWYYGFTPQENPHDKFDIFSTLEDAVRWFIAEYQGSNPVTGDALTAALSTAEASLDTYHQETEGLNYEGGITTFSSEDAGSRLAYVFSALLQNGKSDNRSLERTASCEQGSLKGAAAVAHWCKRSLEKMATSIEEDERLLAGQSLSQNMRAVVRYRVARKKSIVAMMHTLETPDVCLVS